jgi:hypothetical protein
MNGGLIGMLMGFWLHQYLVVAVAGFVVIAAFLSVIYTVWIRASRVSEFSIKDSCKDSWYYVLSLFCLVSGWESASFRSAELGGGTSKMNPPRMIWATPPTKVAWTWSALTHGGNGVP